ncbi:helicase-exonuclease AddAB subunit AddA [Lutispora sp.]|uniref:helicase-exonuclease AddAB subunit AddA n=1 Tax=Lutispora sp. TaxID=2828727 RepID=UPI002B1F1A14|nr:helicase-exonuclease AddAB subunit AddA [Lutispora sp.]MEA4960958.1 helicase-exonuclease AddAB subunit AddA [Lutispora sp.]
MADWTCEQKSAIEVSGCDLLVAAAAGAGKTAVLVERIIRKIINEDSPMDIDNMLIVTFTNAAASEMRERIGEALGKELERKPESLMLQRQMLLLNKASITTIHSFCMDVVKNNFHMLDLDPDFRIADETESVLLKLETIEDLFEEKYEAEDQDFIYLLDRYGGNKDDKKLQDMVLDIFEFVQSSPWPEEWLNKMCKAYDTAGEWDFSQTLWAKIIMEHAKLEIEGALNQLLKAERIAHRNSGYEKCAAQLADDTNMVRQLFKAAGGSWDDLYNAYGGINFSRQQGPDKTADKTDYDELKDLRKDAKERITVLGDGLFNCSSEDIKGDLDALHPIIATLCSLVSSFGEMYLERKKEKAIIDFNDLEHFCLNILTRRDEEGMVIPSPAALSIRDRFKEILVDEYQDSNLVQEAILSAISKRDEGNPNMFMVGDVKQSIYRFRQAKPELFLDKYKRYSETGRSSHEGGSKERKIKLFKNFRSRKEVLDGVNFLFRQLMSLYLGEINYDEGEFLNPGAVFPDDEAGKDEYGHSIELHIIDMKKDESKAEDEREDQVSREGGTAEDIEDLDSIQVEARLIGERILSLMGLRSSQPFRVYDKDLGGYRNLEYRDIVILLRTVKGWSEVFMEELEGMGIPTFADTGTGFFKRSEVQIVMSLLQIIDNPMQDIPLIAVLKSAIAGFSSEELMDIRLEDKEVSFYEALKKISGRGDDLGNKAKSFLERLDGWRGRSVHLPTDELLWYLMRDTGYFSFVGAMPQGHQRQANLKVLFERAKQYEETSFKGLFNFINFINKLKLSSGDMGNAKILGEKDDVVRIMSIHKSKGLEFPVVIIGGAGKQFNLQDARKTMLLHEELGFGIDLVDPRARIAYSTVPKLAIQQRIKLESLSEEMRVLYVALTRAKEKLIITGCDKNLERSVGRWAAALDSREEKLKADMVARGSRYLDWIGLALIRHEDFGSLLMEYGIDGSEALKIHGDESMWDIKAWKKESFVREKAEEEEAEDVMDVLEELEAEKESRKLDEAVVKRLEWIYPYQGSAGLPAKLSVTELKRIIAGTDEDEGAKSLFKSEYLKKPRFLEGKKALASAERGSMMHYIMQHLDLSDTGSMEAIGAQVQRLYEEEYITEEWARAADIKRIYSFFSSPLGRRIKNSKKVYREMPFNIEASPNEVFVDGDMDDSEEKILIQGIIDLYFEEEDRLVLLDYKTDYVDKNNIDEVISRYKTQISYYEKALQIALKRAVDEKYIYLFHTGEAVRV